jgi:2,3-dihydro-2,3-dihydroxybenzoate dehydrogenase
VTHLFGPRRPAIVVGAAHGIGAAVVARLCAWDMVDEVVLVDRDVEAVEVLAAQCFPGVRLHPVVASAGDDLAGACAVLDRPGYGVVTAGVFAGGPSLTVDRASIERVVDTDLVDAMLAARTVAARMAEVGGGSLVVLSSIAARVPRHQQLAYSAAKAGLSQAMRVLGMEVAPSGVRVNTVAPGATDTRFIPPHLDRSTLAAGDSATYRGRVPRGTIATADEVAQTIAVLLSPAMRHVHLHELVVDGGETLGR